MSADSQLERVTVFLTPASAAALVRAAEITGDTRTDVINRAIQAYSLMAGQVAEGSRVVMQQPDTADTYTSTRGEPGDDEPDSPAAKAARDIQALHDPAVIGYVIGLNTLTLTLRPTTWQQWQDWQKRLDCPIGQTTYRGGSATAHGMWGHIPVHVHCVLDRLPKTTEPGDGA